MTSGLPQPVRAVADELERSAGSYLQSVVREPSVTCEVCSTPIAREFRICSPCYAHARSGLNLADRVGALVYAIQPDSQTYLLVYNYKTQAAGPSHERQMKALLALGLRGHARCAKTLANAGTSAWCVVPSTKQRSTLHTLVTQLASPGSQQVAVSYAGPAYPDRSLRPDHWTVELNSSPPDHVLVVDDSWVTGSHAQGVASALKAAGVPQVSVFTVANVLDPGWEPNREFIQQRLAKAAFDKSRCPWTGGECP